MIFGGLMQKKESPDFRSPEVGISEKGKKKTRIDPSSAPVLYAKLIYSEKSKKILSLFKGKGGKDLRVIFCKIRTSA